VFVYILAYSLPAAVIWGVLAIIIHPLTSLSQVMVVIAWLYALTFGVLEAFALPFRPLSLAWQVPAQWLQGRSTFVQNLIWGMTLGPGLVTRNPYAGMWLLPILLTLNHNVFTDVGIGVVIGITHAGMRAFGILSTRRHLDECGSHILKQWRWRVSDGLLLLLGAGSFTAAVLATILH
jgi:hypothetical protein